MLFTSDIDWAPDEVIEDTLGVFAEYGMRCTLFATHDSPVIHAADRELFEIGIHPNFNVLLDGTGGSARAIIQDLLNIYPESLGVRSHSMTQSTPILNLFAEHGLLYDANHFLPYWSGIRPFRLWNGMVRIPYNWEDDLHWTYGHRFDSLDLDRDAGLNVLDFHPIHVFLNTENQQRYDAAKKFYHEPKKLIEYRNTTATPGARDMLKSCLQIMRADGSSGQHLLDVARGFLD